jgi:hypothetical protein
MNHGRLGSAEIEPRPQAQPVAQGGARHATMWHSEETQGGGGSMPGQPEPA